MKRMLTVADVAQIRGTDRTSAFRWLQRNAKSFLRKSGKRILIEARVFAVLNAGGSMPLDPKTERRIQDLEATTRESVRRLDKHAEALIRLHML